LYPFGHIGPTVTWIAPENPGTITFDCTADDDHYDSAQTQDHYREYYDYCIANDMTTEAEPVEVWVVGCEITPVVRVPGAPHSLSPGKTYDVTATITPSLAGTAHSVHFCIESDGEGAGVAVVDEPSSLQSTGPVTVRADCGSQTQVGPPEAPGMYAGRLKVIARLNGNEVCGSSPGFSVCAHIQNWGTTFSEDYQTPDEVGMLVNDSWASDGLGGIDQLDGTKCEERLAEPSRDNPPFTVPGFGVWSGGWYPGDELTQDWLTYTVEDIALDGLAPRTEDNAYRCVVWQLHVQKCYRCGCGTTEDYPDPVVVPNSGREIVDHVWKEGDQWKHRTTAVGRAVNVGVHSSGPAEGDATSPVHDIP
jgi:hypothetical protein